jgi:hypothetical protein
MASDGSRAGAHRAIPNGIAPVPIPEQQPPSSVAAANESRHGSDLTPTQRSKPITDAYHAAQPMCRWPAINGVVVHAIKSGKYADDEILSALLRMAGTGQTVTVESLRIEIEGLAPKTPAPALDRREQARREQRERQMARARQREEGSA